MALEILNASNLAISMIASNLIFLVIYYWCLLCNVTNIKWKWKLETWRNTVKCDLTTLSLDWLTEDEEEEGDFYNFMDWRKFCTWHLSFAPREETMLTLNYFGIFNHLDNIIVQKRKD